jgi:anti-sigma factor RsiW
MTHDDLEISISQYVDGTLADDERIALEARLADDPRAQTLLNEDRALTNVLRSVPAPAIQWDRFADSISAAIDEQLEERVARASWWLRMRVPAGLAMAASVLLAIGLSFHFLGSRSAVHDSGSVNQTHGTQTAVLIVEGPQSDVPTGEVVSQITIAAGGSYAKDSSLTPYADEMNTRPARVVIASGVTLEQPRLGFPY